MNKRLRGKQLNNKKSIYCVAIILLTQLCNGIALAATKSTPSIKPSTKQSQPNILYIMSDDHSAQAIGVYGSRLAKLNPSPNIDILSKQGMVFNNVFVTNSICTPSRATIMTGQYSNVNKVYDLGGNLPGEKQTLTEKMSKAGYATAVIGKWHLRERPAHVDYYAVMEGQGSYMDPYLLVSEGGKKINVSQFGPEITQKRRTPNAR